MKRLPNGYGSITRLTGNRLNPYLVRGPKDGNGNRKIIGCYPSEESALDALCSYRGDVVPSKETLGSVYDMWSKKAYKSLSKSTIDNYKACFIRMGAYENYPISDLRTYHWQSIADDMEEEGMSLSSISKYKALAGQLSSWALQNDLIQKNYAEFISLPKATPIGKLPFFEDEILKIEKASATDEGARLIMILIYTGWRISELCSLKPSDYDAENGILIGGLKTDNGRNRIVPVHRGIKGYVDEYYSINGNKDYLFSFSGKPISAEQFRTTLFPRTLSRLSIPPSLCFDDLKSYPPTQITLPLPFEGEIKRTPHSTRHTFATIGNRYLEPVALASILGHSQKGITAKVYVHPDAEWLKQQINLIPLASEKEDIKQKETEDY